MDPIPAKLADKIELIVIAEFYKFVEENGLTICWDTLSFNTGLPLRLVYKMLNIKPDDTPDHTDDTPDHTDDAPDYTENEREIIDSVIHLPCMTLESLKKIGRDPFRPVGQFSGRPNCKCITIDVVKKSIEIGLAEQSEDAYNGWDFSDLSVCPGITIGDILANPHYPWSINRFSGNRGINWSIVESNPDFLWDRTELMSNPSIDITNLHVFLDGVGERGAVIEHMLLMGIDLRDESYIIYAIDHFPLRDLFAVRPELRTFLSPELISLAFMNNINPVEDMMMLNGWTSFIFQSPRIFRWEETRTRVFGDIVRMRYFHMAHARTHAVPFLYDLFCVVHDYLSLAIPTQYV